jgi:hypothetical protein
MVGEKSWGSEAGELAGKKGRKGKSERGIKTKKEQYRNTLPFLNPISYEKPNRVIQPVCRNIRH